MKSHWLGWVGVTLSLCGAMACGKGHIIVASNVGVPTFVGLPSITNQPHLAVHGKRTANVEVWAINGSSEGRLAPSADSVEWIGTLDLQEGINTVFLYAKSGEGKGEKSTGYSVQLDTTPPSAPTVYAPDAVNVGSTGTVTTTISGTKDPDSSIVINGNTVVSNDGLTAWTTTITVTLGDNNYNITAVDAAGNVSSSVTVDVYGSTLSTPIVLSPNGYATIPPNFNPDDKPFLTNNPNVEFIGSKQGNTDLYFLFNGGAAQDVGFGNSASWDYTANLGADGTYLVGFQVKQVRADGSTERSGTVRIKVMLKTTKPLPPTINSPTFPVADTGDSSLTLQGSLPSPDSYLCVSSTPGGPCIAVSNNYGGSFTVSVPLGDAATQNSSTGDNPLYISARDPYGNISSETMQMVYRVSPPTVVLIQPPTQGDTANISGSSLAVQVSATPNSGDNATAHPSAAIQSVRVCLDIAPCVNATGSNGNYSINPNFDLSGFANGTVHTLTVTVSDSLSTPLQTVITKQLIFSDGSPIWLSNGNTAQTAQNPRSAFDSSGTLHVVWSDYCGQDSNCNVADPNTLQPPDIFYAKRDRSTGTWTAPKLVSMPVSSGDGSSQAPSIAVDNADNVHIAWYDNGTVAGKPSGFGVVHRVLSHTGTLGAPLAVGNPSSGVDDVDPSLAVDPTGTVHAAFTRHTTGTRFDIMYARYVSGAWTSPLQVTPDAATGLAERPSLAGVVGGTAHVAWQECRGAACGPVTNPNHDIYIREITGATSLGFGPFLVSNSTADGDSIQPSLAVDANKTDWVVWRDTATQGSPNGMPHNSPSNIWLEQCASTGCQHGSLSIVSNDSSTAGVSNGGAEQPMVAIGPVAGGDQTVAVVWAQGNPSYNNLDIASKMARVSGGYASLVGNASMRYVAQTANTSQQACVALDSGDAQDLYVVWNDSTPFGAANPSGAEQIFFQLQGP